MASDPATRVSLMILDSRDLSSRLMTHNFVTGSESYYEESAKKYLWGMAEVSPGNMLRKINQFASRDRSIVLVGHGFKGDLAALRTLGSDPQISVVAIFDTAKIARINIGDLSLGHPLVEFGVPASSARLHNAGSDANFTLRALILLGIKVSEASMTGANSTVFESLEALRG